MSRSRRVRRWAVALAAATVLTACGGGGGGGGLGGGNVSAQQYVKSTCTSLGAWVRDVQKRVAAVSQQNPSTAAAGKKLITSFFDAVQWLLLGSLQRLERWRVRKNVEHIVNRYRGSSVSRD